ncbi:hypothetical protein P691DRAFT_789971 [Macrolepiota fuliginosa MF-IS2]|uniref:Nephrocystin 3-like N-terminal domain-containing protein n=1 Tax=Macrolepiota fuliginosa MF-IS2 TaxID=1400762 RepID=A0A9P5XIX3_9AGAR|nr:hypothetical protein P691DRAFT_789971 [Macrolepiota fuliginosa MF-IS2]
MSFLKRLTPSLPGALKRKRKDEEQPPTMDPVQCLSVSGPPTPIQSIIGGDQPANSKHTAPSTCKYSAPPPQQSPTSAMSDTDQTTNHSNAVPSPGALTAITQNIDSGVTVLQQLREKAKPAAMRDSSARDYPPRCHPGTRKNLRGHISQWGVGKGSNRRMLWVLGPAAVGKSAVAQATAEEFDEMERFGAGFFFSRPNHINDPDWVIPTLVYQLATKHRQYKHIITQRLIDDPLILEKNRQVQFRELVIEPFRILMTECPDTVREPLLIILDGLDECEDKEAQVEFINLISTHVRQVDKFPLRWMVCSRPEWHLQTALSNSDFEIVCERQELKVHDPEAQADARHLLGAGFDKIREKYKDRLHNDWPDKDHLLQIATAASGHLGFAYFILRFIGDDQYSDPDSQLSVCIKFLSGGGTIGAMNPLHALDLLYRQILSDVPANTLPTTMRILGFFLFHRPDEFSADTDAKFLNVDQTTFRRSLQNLHSVMYVPPVETSDKTPLSIYHASFSDFLKDPNRSGKFCLNRQAVDYDFTLQCLHWIESNDVQATTTFPVLATSYEAPSWSLKSTFRPEDFDFGCMADALAGTQGVFGHVDFAEFLKWLYSLGSVRNKSLITVISGDPQEPGSISERMQALELGRTYLCYESFAWVEVAYGTRSPNEYIALFIPDIDVLAIELPFTLRLRLGKATHLTGTERPTDIRPQSAGADPEGVCGPGFQENLTQARGQWDTLRTGSISPEYPNPLQLVPVLGSVLVAVAVEEGSVTFGFYYGLGIYMSIGQCKNPTPPKGEHQLKDERATAAWVDGWDENKNFYICRNTLWSFILQISNERLI